MQVNSFTGLLSMFVLVGIFMVSAVGLVNTSCSVMYLLPDAIYNFIGMHTSSVGQMFRHEADGAKNVAGSIAGAAVVGAKRREAKWNFGGGQAGGAPGGAGGAPADPGGEGGGDSNGSNRLLKNSVVSAAT